MAVQNKTADWYHEMLFRSGEICTEITLRQHFYWKDLSTTVHNVCKKFPTFQRAKTTYQKYCKLPPKHAETNPRDTLCVDLIGTYMIPQKGKTLLNCGAS